MNDEPAKNPEVHLNVLPSSGRVDRMREAPRSVPFSPSMPSTETIKTPQQHAILQQVILALRSIFDPEIPVNIYDLGLIYAIDVDAETSAVHVKMTLTAPGCPVAGTLPEEVRKRVAAAKGVSDASVELVWDPPWSKDRMSEAAMLDLGLL